MGRKPRVVIPKTPHHVVLRGNNRRRLFSQVEDYEMFLFFLGAAERERECQVHAVTLMTNHVHLVVTPLLSSSLPAFVKLFAQRYAQLRNLQRNASGKLFEERYFSVPILSERQLGVVTAYVHANPIRAGIVSDALEYPWSTHAHHADASGKSKIPAALWTPSSWYVSLGTSPRQRAARYIEAFMDYVERGVEPERVREKDLAEWLAEMPCDFWVRRPDRTRAD